MNTSTSKRGRATPPAATAAPAVPSHLDPATYGLPSFMPLQLPEYLEAVARRDEIKAERDANSQRLRELHEGAANGARPDLNDMMVRAQAVVQGDPSAADGYLDGAEAARALERRGLVLNRALALAEERILAAKEKAARRIRDAVRPEVLRRVQELLPLVSEVARLAEDLDRLQQVARFLDGSGRPLAFTSYLLRQNVNAGTSRFISSAQQFFYLDSDGNPLPPPLSVEEIAAAFDEQQKKAREEHEGWLRNVYGIVTTEDRARLERTRELLVERDKQEREAVRKGYWTEPRRNVT